MVKDMIRRLQELRHTEQVQRAYALNCGEGATVSYELQLRVLREFGLADGATELLQVSRKQRIHSPEVRVSQKLSVLGYLENRVRPRTQTDLRNSADTGLKQTQSDKSCENLKICFSFVSTSMHTKSYAFDFKTIPKHKY